MKNKQSIENLFEIFNAFSLFSGLKPNLLLCKIAVMQALKGVQVAACDMGCTDLCSEVIKILDTHFSYNRKIKQCNFLFALILLLKDE